ncbi:hypothetical protein BO71DRAFT_364855 [Aspergillus ellipticus CBS 707.79]|uniref:Uncharacterized protein n=1 Tax=Aspergillus ellipticus CBS 707.79 TaxID=1448320 RepID=A0A319CTZ0_9EURO|nr:hypothetical protein BO71DRAFT_364855 [Aspergillus ellipticus CBS 707.79]
MGSKHSTAIPLPGFGLPLNHRQSFTDSRKRGVFPNALDPDDLQKSTVGHENVQREINMMQVMNAITDKPGWERKVFDEEITAEWRHEVAQSGQDVTPKMMDYIIKEMQWKAGVLREKGLVYAFDVGVVRSDTAVSPQLQQRLREAVVPLERIPASQKDYHPGSGGKVVDLVHPSLFPVVYGRTRILPEGRLTTTDCMESIGQGEVIPIPPAEETKQHWRRNAEDWNAYSRRFQWLPCDVELPGEGGCRIVSYINNLHPAKYQPLYHTVEQVITAAIPLWDSCLTEQRGFLNERIPYPKVEFLPHPDPEPKPRDEDDADSDEYCERHWDWLQSQPIKQPEPGGFSPPTESWRGPVDLRKDFREHGLQVIVKLANIELTAENPDYEGGSWHIEGQLNERICATALYYYDSQNITESRLAFRQRASQWCDVSYPQSQHEFLQAVYGFGPEVSGWGDTQITQDLGSVVCREGRMITFPNTVQHRVLPFSLADRTQPGHRKILAVFLIDPHQRIISSANVPPQQEEWARERQELVRQLLSEKLPGELQEMVSGKLSDEAMTMEEAKQYRLELMKERGAKQTVQNERFETGAFNLCEH